MNHSMSDNAVISSRKLTLVCSMVLMAVLRSLEYCFGSSGIFPCRIFADNAACVFAWKGGLKAQYVDEVSKGGVGSLESYQLENTKLVNETSKCPDV